MPNKQARAFCFTSFKLELKDKNWDDLIPEPLNYIIMGLETAPRTGRKHLQGYVEFSKKTTMNVVKRTLGDMQCHVEIRQGPQDKAIEYCKKEGDWNEWGEAYTQGKRTDLDMLKKDLEEGMEMVDLADKYFSDYIRYHRGIQAYKDLLDRKRQKTAEPATPEVIVYVGQAGSGKSHHCYHDEEYQRSGYKFLQQQEGKCYFDGYENQKCIWFDEFSGKTMRFSDWCRLADKWGTRVETKGGSVEVIGLRRILISTTLWPGEWWKSSAKFQSDTYQLWRRLTAVYWLDRPVDGQYKLPLLIKEPEKVQLHEYLDWMQNGHP